MIYTIKIPSWHPATINQLLGVHWAERGRIKKSDHRIIAHYARLFSVPAAPNKRSLSMTIMLRKGQRAADPDAYYKSVLDALKNEKLLVDDNRQWLELLPVQFLRGTEYEWGTIIYLQDIDGSARKLPAAYADGYEPDYKVKSKKVITRAMEDLSI